MHLALILTVLAGAWVWRQRQTPATGSWQQRWQASLIGFVLPPALLLGTALAIAIMGARGRMWGMPASKLASLIALGFLGWAVCRGLYLLYLSWQDERRLQTYPHQTIAGETVRLAPTAIPASAHVGIWQPEILLTTGLLAHLDAEQMQAVVAHERAHAYYRDTFWFFGLGWLRAVTTWLPNTEALWQELLLLRELRADRRAAEENDSLALAEALLAVARYPLTFAEARCAPFNCAAPSERLQERIEALLVVPAADAAASAGVRSRNWWYLGLALLPLATLPFHCHC